MPLDDRKAQRILQLINRSFAGRQRPVVVVYRTGVAYSYSLLQVIMRAEQNREPQILSATGQPLPQSTDTWLLAPLGTNFTGAVYIADTATANASAVAASAKYEIIEVLPVGLVPGGSHLRLQLRRMR
ncbi:hypothetical protein [Tengunoibacter tsumagoiensis]|uniref:Uncharacterized protein n=1 Tax=Tengunoibacter tsumagoiensis TaxID=2014871 RepID=A0A402A2N3_9CHLR|nr:hypothetical protein [Tengunoibacter tsumagoiensis]GCE13316.1 hypothetical protein KTT_31750 [Tengunoibacter tsumagoiensis]